MDARNRGTDTCDKNLKRQTYLHNPNGVSLLLRCVLCKLFLRHAQPISAILRLSFCFQPGNVLLCGDK